MKMIVLFCAGVLFAGCASDRDDYRGAPPRQSRFESSTNVDGEWFYGTETGSRSTDRQIPARNGPGGLGRPDY